MWRDLMDDLRSSGARAFIGKMSDVLDAALRVNRDLTRVQERAWQPRSLLTVTKLVQFLPHQALQLLQRSLRHIGARYRWPELSPKDGHETLPSHM